MDKRENAQGTEQNQTESMTSDQQLAELERVLKEVEMQLNAAEQKTRQDVHDTAMGTAKIDQDFRTEAKHHKRHVFKRGQDKTEDMSEEITEEAAGKNDAPADEAASKKKTEQAENAETKKDTPVDEAASKKKTEQAEDAETKKDAPVDEAASKKKTEQAEDAETKKDTPVDKAASKKKTEQAEDAETKKDTPVDEAASKNETEQAEDTEAKKDTPVDEAASKNETEQAEDTEVKEDAPAQDEAASKNETDSDQEDAAPVKKKSWIVHAIRAVVVLDVFLVLYFVAVFSNIPFIVKWRTLYIETAMSTTSHQWLATAFIPKGIIDEVVEKRNWDIAKQQLIDSGWDTKNNKKNKKIDAESEFYELYWELDTPNVRQYLSSYLSEHSVKYDNILIEDFDEQLGLETVKGDPVLVLDTANNLMIIGIKGDEYVGKMALIKDPAQVHLGKSDYLGSRGEIVDKYGEKYNALLAVNASGFKDVEGHGSGGQVRGSLVIDGVDYGDHAAGKSHWKFIGMQTDDRLYITSYSLADISDYKWAVEFSPALIVNGEIVAEGSFGWGIQPRTTIGQAQDGTFMILLIDGRQLGYSVGCTVGECAIIMDRYKAYQAANLDGGSSSVMWYKDRQITKSSSPSGFGRYLPDAIYIKKADTIND